MHFIASFILHQGRVSLKESQLAFPKMFKSQAREIKRQATAITAAGIILKTNLGTSRLVKIRKKNLPVH